MKARAANVMAAESSSVAILASERITWRSGREGRDAPPTRVVIQADRQACIYVCMRPLFCLTSAVDRQLSMLHSEGVCRAGAGIFAKTNGLVEAGDGIIGTWQG